MAILTDRLAPRIIINENDIPSPEQKERKSPVTLLFGFAPIGKTLEMVVCNNSYEITKEFGSPTSAPEKYFIDAATRLVDSGATTIMTRLPYDNDQCHNVKYVDFKLEEPIGMIDIASGPAEEKTREKDDIAVTILDEMNELDNSMGQLQRISQKSYVDQNGDEYLIGTMSNEDLINLELDPQDNLDENTFRLVDIRGNQYGSGQLNIEYGGIFPIIVTAPMAMYYQNRIEQLDELNNCFRMVELEHGIETSTDWYRRAIQIDDWLKEQQLKIIDSINTTINTQFSSSSLHRGSTFQDNCLSRFPMINMESYGRLDKTNLKKIGILICELGWDSDQQRTTISILESYVGELTGMHSIDRQINSKSEYVKMYKNLTIPNETDFFVCNDLKITSIGMSASECVKNINYKTSIFDPITHMLEHIYSDVDSLQLDVILDAGLSSTAFQAYVNKNQYGENYKSQIQFGKDNDNEMSVTTQVNWTSNSYPIDEYIEDYAIVWNKLTTLFGDFCKNVRGDCVYIADGPRIMNLERNYPIRNFTNTSNVDMFNKFLPYFNGNTNNYIARYFNWVYIEDMQYVNRGFWVPGSVVMGSQLSINDKNGHIWFAPAGQNRGIVQNAYDISVRTKQYNQENDILYRNNWNFFNVYQNEGVIVEGQKTLQTKKTSLDRLNVRRMICYIKQQIRIISNRYKYEQHTPDVRESYRNELAIMLEQIKKTSGISDYAILCDETNNTTETIDRHELWCKIGIKPIKAIEYIIIDLNIINGNVNING